MINNWGGALDGLHHCETLLGVLPTITVPIALFIFLGAILVENSYAGEPFEP